MTQATHEQPASPAPTKARLLSVIVPCYNSSKDLERCLAGLASSAFSDFEVLVVDDGSTEPIEPIVRKHGFGYMRIDGPGGPARARNRGVESVSGEFVVFIDADVVVHADTLSAFAERIRSEPALDAIIGTYDDEPGDPGFLSQYKNLFHHYVHQTAHGDICTFWSGCGAMRRDLFLKFGGFDEVRYRRPAIEDIELGTWVAAAGHRIVLDNRVRCKHLKRWTLKSLLKTDIFDRGIPWTRLMHRARDLPNTLNVTTSQRASVALVYLTMMSLPLIAWNWRAAVVPLSLALLITVINWDFYRYFAARRGVLFSLGAAFFHWLYFVYCGLSFILGTIASYRDGDAKHAARPHGVQSAD